jgi:hypothetical protein
VVWVVPPTFSHPDLFPINQRLILGRYDSCRIKLFTAYYCRVDPRI